MKHSLITLRSAKALRHLQAGFTLIELLVVMAIVSTLLSIVVPRFTQKIDTAKEVALKENLNVLRIALDQYRDDKGRYPEKLTDLVAHRYLRVLPIDPVTERRDTWVLKTREEEGGVKVIHDLHSAAKGNGSDGTPYASW